MIHHFPLMFQILFQMKNPAAFAKSVIKKLAGHDTFTQKAENTPDNVKKTAKARVSGWKKQFNLTDVQNYRPDERLLAVFEKTSDTLRRILDLCVENQFQPVILSMPVCKEESGEFAESFIEEFYNKNIRRANVHNVPTFNYFRDGRFHDPSLFINADCLNERGRKFFAEVLIGDLKKTGLWRK